jgi:hypothetical protein
MSTDAIIPSVAELTRSTELPAQELQRAEEAQTRKEVWDLTQMPGWRLVEEIIEKHIDVYDRPKFNPGDDLAEIGKQALFAQTIAGRLKEIRDDIRNAARG